VSVDIANESGVSVDEVALVSVAQFVLGELRIHPLAELSVLLVDDKVMAGLHERWMGEPGPADVLSFPMDELRPPGPPHLGGGHGDRSGPDGPDHSPALLGDIVLCPQVAAEQAREAKHSTAEELELLCTHGLLHLLGYDHADADERAVMFGLQDRLLASWRAARAPAAASPAAASPAAASPAAASPAGTSGQGSDDEGRKGPG